MHKFIKMGFLSFLLTICGCQQHPTTFKSVNAEEFANFISQPDVQILDVRTAEEFANGHIANSLNLDVTEDDFTVKAKNKLNKEIPVAVYCRSGRRSKMAAENLEQEGFKVVELGGGYNEWTECNRDVVK